MQKLSLFEIDEIQGQIEELSDKLDDGDSLSLFEIDEIQGQIEELFEKLGEDVEFDSNDSGDTDTTETATAPAFVSVLNKVIAGEFDSLGAAGAFAKITEINMEVENSPYESLGCQALEHVANLAVKEKEGYLKAAA